MSQLIPPSLPAEIALAIGRARQVLLRLHVQAASVALASQAILPPPGQTPPTHTVTVVTERL